MRLGEGPGLGNCSGWAEGGQRLTGPFMKCKGSALGPAVVKAQLGCKQVSRSKDEEEYVEVDRAKEKGATGQPG